MTRRDALKRAAVVSVLFSTTRLAQYAGPVDLPREPMGEGRSALQCWHPDWKGE